MKALSFILITISIFTFILTQKAMAINPAFVNCQGQLTISTQQGSKNFSGTVTVEPYLSNGQFAWKVVVTGPEGKYEVKPIKPRYVIEQQMISFTYVGSDGNLELGVALDKAAQIDGDHRGDMGLSLSDSVSTNIETGAHPLRCILRKYKID